MKDSHKTFTKFELRGTWCLPNVSDTQYFGVFQFDPETGPILTIMGEVFTGNNSDILEIPPEVEIIQGRCEGKIITLIDCSASAPSFINMPVNTGQRKIYSEYALVSSNGYFPSKDEVEFASVSASYSHLDSWMQHYGYKVFKLNSAPTFINNEHSTSKVDLVHNGFSREYPLNNMMTVTFGYHKKVDSGLNGVSFHNHAKVSFKSDEPSDFFRAYLPYLRDYIPSFLTLATGYANFPLQIVGHPSDDPRLRCAIYYRVPGYVDNQKYILPNNMLFQFHDVENELERYINSWSKFYQKLPHLINLFTKPFYFWIDPYTELVELVTVAEVCLSIVYHKPNEKQVVTKLCEEHNDIPQLLEIVTCYSVFGKDVQDVRNALVHEGTTNTDIGDVDTLAQKMRLLIKMCLLRSIGCDPDTISSFVKNSREYKDLKHKS